VPAPLLDVLTGKPAIRRPVWLMRQAGRYLPEYRALRQRAGSFLELCYTPEWAQDVTLQPLRRFDLDAAIVFSDILVVPHGMGSTLDFVEQEGPVLSITADDQSVDRLSSSGECWQFERVYETLRGVKQALEPEIALIGFCGAPWTVASYMVEGRGSDRQRALNAAREGERWFEALIEKVTAVSVAFLVGQVRAGADVVQIFDSWAGDLPESLRERWIYRPIAQIVEGLRAIFPEFPVIVFGRGLGRDHGNLAEESGANAVGVEQGYDLGRLVRELPEGVVIQGNLAPEFLLAGGQGLAAEVERICRVVPRSRHIFNLGHGILQQTPPLHVTELLAAVRRFDEMGG
jgi:uroporphyrinogen decarboxylase